MAPMGDPPNTADRNTGPAARQTANPVTGRFIPWQKRIALSHDNDSSRSGQMLVGCFGKTHTATGLAPEKGRYTQGSGSLLLRLRCQYAARPRGRSSVRTNLHSPAS